MLCLVDHWAVGILERSILVQKGTLLNPIPERMQKAIWKEKKKKKERMYSEFADHCWKLTEAS